MLRLEPLTAGEVSVTADDTYAVGYSGETIPMLAIRLRTTRAQWRNAVALSWAKTGEAVPIVAPRMDRDVWTFADGDRVVVLNWTTGEAQIRR